MEMSNRKVKSSWLFNVGNITKGQPVALVLNGRMLSAEMMKGRAILEPMG